MKKLEKKILSINHEDNDNGLEEFEKFLENHTENQKIGFLKEITERGDDYLQEISLKKRKKEPKKQKLIQYILDKSDVYSEKELSEYDFESVFEIHNEIKYENRPFLRKIFDYVFFNK